MTLSAVGAVLELEDVGVRLGARWVLQGIDLRVEPGVPVGIAGPSGSGKTVLCSVMAGVVAPTRGQVRHAYTRDLAPSVGLILQNHGLLSGLSAAENVAFPLQARRLTREDVAAQVVMALDSVGLGEHLHRPVDELSGGQRQRVGVAGALAGNPDVLIADEPTAELDPDNRARVLKLLLEHAARGHVLVIASDDPEVIGACARVVHIHEGEIVRTTVARVEDSGSGPAGAPVVVDDAGAAGRAASTSDTTSDAAGAEGARPLAEARDVRAVPGRLRPHRRRPALFALGALGALGALSAGLGLSLSGGSKPVAPAPATAGSASAYLGVTTRTVPAGSPPGALVSAVAASSPAEHAGIKVGDIIVLFGSKLVRTAGELRRDLQHTRPGTRKPLTWVTPKGLRETAQVPLSSPPRVSLAPGEGS